MDPVAALLAIPGVGPYVPYLLFASAVATALVNFVLPAPTATSNTVYTVIFNALHILSNFKTPQASPPLPAKAP